MKNIFWTLFVLTIFSSCATQKRCTAKFPIENSRDSVYIETVEKVPVYIPGDSILVNVPVTGPCPDQTLSTIETSELKQTIKILNGRLISATLIKPDTVYVFKTDTVTITREVKVPAPEKYIPKFYKFTFWYSIITWILLIAYFAFKIKKLII